MINAARRRARSSVGRFGALVAVAMVALLATGGTAYADPAGPTDYRSEILSIEPPTPEVTFTVIGGDSFVQLEVGPDSDVLVLGYFAEPYLHFLPDGEVRENRNSPTTYQNEDRYGTDAPDFADADAEPDWVTVADDGRYAWHDHRAHWMQPIRPAGKAPGDRIVEQVIPIVVDGTDVDVTVISVWQPEPSMAPAWLGAALGAATAAGMYLLWRGGRGWTAALLPVAVAATVAGGWQYSSLPAETGPRLVWFVLPVAAVVALVVAVTVGRRSTFTALAAGLIAATQLVIWSFVKRDGLTAAIVPTDAPQWFDRMTLVAAFVAGVVGVALATVALFRPSWGTRPADPAT